MGPVARGGGFASLSWPTGTQAWARGGSDMRRSRRPMGNGGSPAGKCAQPRSTGLSFHASVTGSSAQWQGREPQNDGHSGASACAHGPGTAS
jgi:hypothetical protein